MATTVTSNAPPSRDPFASKAIQDGTDAVLALIEEESQRRAAHLQQELIQVQSDFTKYREQSAQAQVHLEEQLRAAQRDVSILKGALDKSIAENASARADSSRARKELSAAKKSLAQLKTALGKVGVTFDEIITDNDQGGSNVVFRRFSGERGDRETSTAIKTGK